MDLLPADVAAKDVGFEPVDHDEQAVAGAEAHVYVGAFPKPGVWKC